VNVLTPPKLNTPTPVFTNDPAKAPSTSAPPNVPLPKVSSVPSSVSNPLDPPSNVCNCTAGAPTLSEPSNVTDAVTGTDAPEATVIAAPDATFTVVDAKLPPPLKTNVPAFTDVAPVNVFTPLNVTSPVVDFVNPPVPAKTLVTNPFFTK
jgi:hypothetical protein